MVHLNKVKDKLYLKMDIQKMLNLLMINFVLIIYLIFLILYRILLIMIVKRYK